MPQIIIEVDESSPFPSPSPSPQMRRDNEGARATQDAANQLMSLQLEEQTPAVGVEETQLDGRLTDEHISPSLDTSSDHGHSRSRGRPQVSGARMMSNLARFSSIASRRGPVARSLSLERTTRLRTTHGCWHGHRIAVRTGISIGDEWRSANIEKWWSWRICLYDQMNDRLGAVEDIRMSAGILDSITNRNFNEDDYEMLLALDRGINHGGASGSQINGLPLSTVGSKLEEACAICLETPTVGDTIRHLPCLHKIHKDCINPWLGRRTSCPVCKLSIMR